MTLVQLGRLGREYDQISRGEHWPATGFVEWLTDEWRANTMNAPLARPFEDSEAA